MDAAAFRPRGAEAFDLDNLARGSIVHPMGPVDMVELAYQGARPTEAWLLDLLRRLPWIEASSAAFAYQVDISRPTEPAITNFVSLFGPCDREWVEGGHRFLLANGTRRLYRRRLTTARTTFGAKHPVVRKFLASSGIRDGVGMFAVDSRGIGAVLSTQSASVYQLTAKERHTYALVSTHVAAAVRLRGYWGAAPTPDQADAVLSPGGKLLHAERDAKTSEGRALLRNFTRTVDRARGITRFSDPTEALEAWTALLDGRWSLVDHFDSDGRRLCLFLRNDPGLRPIQPLTTQQRQVVTLAALGAPNKLIGYEVGLSESGVSQALRAAMMRLCVRRRTDLVRVLGPLAENLSHGPRHEAAGTPRGTPLE